MMTKWQREMVEKLSKSPRPFRIIMPRFMGLTQAKKTVDEIFGDRPIGRDDWYETLFDGRGKSHDVLINRKAKL